MPLNLRFIVVKLAEVRKEVQCPICLGMYFNLSVLESMKHPFSLLC